MNGDRIKLSFVYAQRRDHLTSKIGTGEAPDSGLHGANHLPDIGIDTEIYESPLVVHRSSQKYIDLAAWYVRELTLPLELRHTDAICTTYRNAYPLAERGLRGRPVFILNMGVTNALQRWALEGKRVKRRIVLASLESCAAVICHSRSQRDRLMAESGLGPDQAQWAQLGVDERYFTPRGGPPGDYVFAIGFDIGRDYATLLEAMAGLPDQRAIIACRPRNVKGLTVPPNVEIELSPSFERLRELYAGARCVAIPTHPEDWPYAGDMSGATVLVEAMAMGKPVVISRQGAWSDYVTDGESALLVEPRDADELREALRRTFEDDALCDALGRAGREIVEDRLTTRHYAQRMAKIVRSRMPGTSGDLDAGAGAGRVRESAAA